MPITFASDHKRGLPGRRGCFRASLATWSCFRNVSPAPQAPCLRPLAVADGVAHGSTLGVVVVIALRVRERVAVPRPASPRSARSTTGTLATVSITLASRRPSASRRLVVRVHVVIKRELHHGDSLHDRVAVRVPLAVAQHLCERLAVTRAQDSHHSQPVRAPRRRSRRAAWALGRAGVRVPRCARPSRTVTETSTRSGHKTWLRVCRAATDDGRAPVSGTRSGAPPRAPRCARVSRALTRGPWPPQRVPICSRACGWCFSAFRLDCVQRRRGLLRSEWARGAP